MDPLGLAMSKIKNVFSLSMNENKKSGPSENKSPLAARPIPPSMLFIRSYPVSSSFLLYFGNVFANSHHCELLAAAIGPGPLGLQ